MDPILGEMRTINISGGTGGVDHYTFNTSEFTVGITGLVSLNQVPGNKVSGTASVEDVQTGGAQRLVDVTALRGALTAGQAVDVTSQPDNVTGDYKGTFSVTGSLGFASFPKYASGLNYLMIADLTATTSGTVTPSGTWLDGTTTAKSLAAGTSTRVAMLFSTASTCKLTFSGTGSVSVSNCREYEVTACSNEAISYIASLSNPDAFASYYLVKADMVQPWTYIIDMGTSPAVTIASGLSYKLNAATGTHQLMVDTCPAGYDGRDALIRIRLGGTGVVQAVAPLQLGGALIPYAVNNCVVRFRDGEAVLLVEDTLAGYVVTVNTGTGEGSLPYGLAANGVPYIAFSPSTDGIPVELSGATTAAEEVAVVGNGYTETALTGAINCTSKTIFANLALQNVVVNGGTMTLGDTLVQGEVTAATSNGIAIEKATVLSGGTISNFYLEEGGRLTCSSGGIMQPNKNVYFFPVPVGTGSAVAYISGGTVPGGFGLRVPARGTNRKQPVAILDGITFYGNAQLLVYQGGITSASHCDFSGTTGYAVDGNTPLEVTLTDCSFNSFRLNGGTYNLIGNTLLQGTITMAAGGGTLNIAEGAVLDMTGNNNATPVGVSSGKLVIANNDPTKSCTIINSGGTSIAVAGGTYTSITNGGVVA